MFVLKLSGIQRKLYHKKALKKIVKIYISAFSIKI